MTLLDRFRTSSPQKHPDPNVRLAYVESLPLEDREGIAVVAREDEDPRVRRAAVAKLMDAAKLGSVARDDRDEGVRGQATDMLRDIALEVFEGIGETEALDAVEALSDQRGLIVIAKTASRDVVALRALSSVTDSRAWGSIARHGAVESARRAALDLLRDHAEQGEILAVALNGEFKDAAQAAVDLLSDDAQLEQVVARGKNKAAVKRARAILREKAGPIEPELPAAPVEAIASVIEPPVESIDLERESRDAEREAERATAAREAAEKVSEREREKAEGEVRATATRLARLTELAEQAIQAASDTDLSAARRQLSRIRRDWTELARLAAPDPSVAARFAEAEEQVAVREHEVNAADARAKQEALTHVTHLIGRIEALTARSDLSLKAAERAARDLRSIMAAPRPLPTKQDADEVSRRLKAAHVALTPKLQELRNADDWQRWANAGVQEDLCKQMEALNSLEDPEAIARSVRELQEQWRKAADVPRAQADALWRRFKTAHDVVWPRCEAHFAAEAQARTENLARRVALCEKAEALADSTDWIRTADEIKGFQAEWKTIGPVPRGREKAVWERFRTACDRFFTRRHEDLAHRKTIWNDNFAKKTALCEKAEALASSTDWDVAAAEIRQLQTEWKSIGAVKKSRSEAIWQRFRAACDQFFARYGQRHDQDRADRVAAREQICAELESLGSDSASGTETVIADAATPTEVVSTQADPVSVPGDILGSVRALRARWQQEIAARGVDPERARGLDARFGAAYAYVLAKYPAAFAGTDLDPDAGRKRMEALVTQVEALAHSIAGPAADETDPSISPTARLASMLKEALAANTIGGKGQDSSRLNAALEEVRQAQASWSRIGTVPEPVRRPLADRFQRATRTILERAGKATETTDGRTGTSPRNRDRDRRPVKMTAER